MQKAIAVATISGKHQITLPAGICRALRLREGDKLSVTLSDDQLILKLQPQGYVEEYEGRLKGVYGNEQEIEEYLREERLSWRRNDAAE